MLQRSREPLDPGPLSLVILPTNRKSILGQYRGRGPGLERGKESGTADSRMDSVGEAQWVSGRTSNRAARLAGRPGHVQVPAESRADISAHGFLIRGTTSMFDIIFVDLDVGSCLCMAP